MGLMRVHLLKFDELGHLPFVQAPVRCSQAPACFRPDLMLQRDFVLHRAAFRRVHTLGWCGCSVPTDRQGHTDPVGLGARTHNDPNA
jgi:hypothetical protein